MLKEQMTGGGEKSVILPLLFCPFAWYLTHNQSTVFVSPDHDVTTNP